MSELLPAFSTTRTGVGLAATPAAVPSTPAATAMGMLGALDGGEQLLAEQPATSSSVNALANLAAATPSSSSISSVLSQAESAGLNFQLPSPIEGSFTAAPPIQYQTAGTAAVAGVENVGDKALGDLVDASDDDSTASASDDG